MLSNESLSCRPSPSRHAVHHCQVAIAPSFAVHCHCNRSPLALHSRRPSPSITAKEPLGRPSPLSCQFAIHCHPSPLQSQSSRDGAIPCRSSPSRSCCAVHCHQGAIASSIDAALHRPSPSSQCPSTSVRPLLSSLFCAIHCRPSLSSHRCAVHRRPPSITIESLLRHPLLSSLPSHCCPPSITGQRPLHLRC